MSNPYEVLGVSKDCTQGEITKAFRKKAQQLHPDRAGGSEEGFKELQAAYEKIGTVEARKDFDEGKMPLSIDDVRSTLLKSMRSALAENVMVKVLPRLYAFIEQELFRNKAALLSTEGKLKKLRANRGRMSVKGGTPNLFEEAMDLEIKAKEGDLTSTQEVISMLQAMKTELANYTEGEVSDPNYAPARYSDDRIDLLRFGA